MHKGIKIVGIGLGVLVLGVVGFVGIKVSTADFSHPDTPLPEIEASEDAELVARGKYLVHHVAHCSSCHAMTDGELDLSTWKLDPEAPIAGGYLMEAGPFGTYVAANLTPHETTGIGRYSDGQVARVIKYGVGPDGTFAPLMRLGVGPIADEDIGAIISYLRSREPVERNLPPEEFGILAKLLADEFGPREEHGMKAVQAGDEPSVERGKYLAEGPALCMGCHTPMDPMAGFAFSGDPYSGGGELEPDHTDPEFGIIAPNITPWEKGGRLGVWTEDQFVERMRGGRAYAGSKMAWEAFAGMTDNDLRSIYRYLQTVPVSERDTGPVRQKM